MNLIAYPDRELMMLDVADVLASELAATLRHEERASFCVPGGTTPGPIFDVLSAVSLDWDRVVVFPSDERWVPESDDRSNGRLIRSRLLTGRAAAAAYLPFYAPGIDPEKSLDDLNAALAPHLPISVLLLGMGVDMHTASLFPGAENLSDALASEAPPVMALRAPASGELRVSLTAPTLASALAIHILITGEDKRAALARANDLPPEAAPIQSVLANATVHWAA
jgi:6-phosphogluconolactonase